jgi:hypothetical protein
MIAPTEIMMQTPKTRIAPIATPAAAPDHILAAGLLGLSMLVFQPQSVRADSSHFAPSGLMASSAVPATAAALYADRAVDAYSVPASSRFGERSAPVPRSSRRRIMDRALGRVAREFNKIQGRSEGPIEYYRNRLQKLQDSSERAEETAGSLGIDKASFRQGIGVTAAGAAAVLGAVHLVNPVGVTNYLLSTGFRAGYDVSQLDDPKVYLSYDDTFRVGVNRDGLVGSFTDKSGRLYSADLNIFKMRATMRLNF